MNTSMEHHTEILSARQGAEVFVSVKTIRRLLPNLRSLVLQRTEIATTAIACEAEGRLTSLALRAL
jgi:hypothetical protein